MTVNEKINEVIAMVSELAYKALSNSTDYDYFEDWAGELTDEMPKDG